VSPVSSHVCGTAQPCAAGRPRSMPTRRRRTNAHRLLHARQLCLIHICGGERKWVGTAGTLRRATSAAARKPPRDAGHVSARRARKGVRTDSGCLVEAARVCCGGGGKRVNGENPPRLRMWPRLTVVVGFPSPRRTAGLPGLPGLPQPSPVALVQKRSIRPSATSILRRVPAQQQQVTVDGQVPVRALANHGPCASSLTRKSLVKSTVQDGREEAWYHCNGRSHAHVLFLFYMSTAKQRQPCPRHPRPTHRPSRASQHPESSSESCLETTPRCLLRWCRWVGLTCSPA
jgi:hypothetical protein